jgi:PhnB protein
MKLDIYLNYAGNCEEAFRFYERHLGGKITTMMRHEEHPNPGLPPEFAKKILHAQIDLGGAVLMGADIPGAEAIRSAYCSLTLETDAEAEHLCPAHGRRADLHEDGENILRLAVRDAPRQVRHVLDAAQRSEDSIDRTTR